MNDLCSHERLELALARSLDADEQATLHRHLDECELCAAEMERLAGGEQASREIAAMLMPDDLDDALPLREECSIADFVVDHLEPSDDPAILGRLGGYDVIDIIGRGGMGVVLKGFDRELKRFVAIKALAPHLAHSALARKRFAREAQAAAAVVNLHVIAIHQVQPNGQLPFLVMPLLTGESLAQRLKARGTLELKEILRIGMQAAEGLTAAHGQGLIHRDVKPANILLEKGVERAVLTDFGLARAADDVSMTRWGIIAGTPEYMSPEQARGEALDGRSDLFSLGCVLYEMATGVSPFRTDSTMATLRRIVDEQPASMASLVPELPPWFGHIVERLLSKDPAQRIASASEVSQLLEQCLSHLQQPTSVPLPFCLMPQATGRPSIFSLPRKGLFAMLGTIGFSLLGMFLWQSSEPPDIGGQWSGEEWGQVVLKKAADAEYAGNYNDTLGQQPGEIHLKWSRLERRFNGTWREGGDRRGQLSVRLVDDEIRGAWTTDTRSKEKTGTPRLADLTWTRSSERNERAVPRDGNAGEQINASKRQRFEPVEGQPEKTSWAVFAPPSLFSKTDWVVMARMTIGGEARIQLTEDKQLRCVIKLIKGSDEAITVQVQDVAKKSKTIVSIARDQSAEVTVDGAGYNIRYPSVEVALEDADSSPFAQVIVRRVENQGKTEVEGDTSAAANNEGPRIKTVGPAEPPSIDGTWEVRRFDKATGHAFAGLELVLKSDGETLLGTAVWPDGKETPIAAGSIADGRVSFNVTPGSVIQDYGGEIEGDVIRGRWAVNVASFDWEARRAVGDVTAEQLHGRWNFEHGALGEFDTLELQRDDRFRLEHSDVALGTTTTSGSWSREEREVVLREERYDVGGEEVRDRVRKTERLRIRQTADGLRLGKPLREFQRPSTNRKEAPEIPPSAKADHLKETTKQFTGVSDTRSLEKALADALRLMDEAVAQEAKYPCQMLRDGFLK